VAELAGVQTVVANVDTKQATITFDAPATEEQIKAVLASINYPAAN